MQRIRWACRILKGRGVPFTSKIRASVWVLMGKMRLTDEKDEV